MPNHEKTTQYWSHWLDLIQDLTRRLKAPPQQPIFILYFVSVMCGVGLLGTWMQILEGISTNTWPNLSNNLASYAIAVVASTFAEVVLSSRAGARDEDTQFGPAFQMFALCIVVVCVGLGMTAFTLSWTTSAIAAAFASLFLWWVVNAGNRILQEPDPVPAAPLGGKAEDALSGDLQDIQV